MLPLDGNSTCPVIPLCVINRASTGVLRSTSVEPPDRDRGLGQAVWASMASINSDMALGGSLVALDVEENKLPK